LLKSEWFAQEIIVESLGDDFLKQIKQAFGNKDKSVTKALEKNNPEWETQDNKIVTWKGIIYIPRDAKL
jgi:hypothetical protein